MMTEGTCFYARLSPFPPGKPSEFNGPPSLTQALFPSPSRKVYQTALFLMMAFATFYSQIPIKLQGIMDWISESFDQDIRQFHNAIQGFPPHKPGGFSPAKLTSTRPYAPPAPGVPALARLSATKVFPHSLFFHFKFSVYLHSNKHINDERNRGLLLAIRR